MRNNICKWLILGTVAYAMLCMLHWPIGFTMFTQLSNLFAAAAVALQLAADRGTERDRTALRYVKFAATVSITVTMVVYAAVIAPFSSRGIIAAYLQDHGASLCMHLLVPLLMLADFYLCDAEYAFKAVCVPYSLLPPALWMLMIGLLGAFGMRWFGGMAAPYPFLNYLAPAGWLGFAPETVSRTTLGVGVLYCILLMMALFAGVAAAQWKCAAAAAKKNKERDREGAL